MLVSINELKKLVDIEGLSPVEIADKLTFAGLEVEEISALAEGTNLVVGKILKCEKMDNSDHLHILEVDEGEKYGINQIVCGAPNARTGIKVIVARPGAKLKGGEIKDGVIRGIESHGMCCSINELGVDHKYLSEQDIAGIKELDEDAKVGDEEVLKLLGLDDVILNVKILPNRSDAMSMLNIAYEVSALFERKMYPLDIKKVPEEKSSFVVTSKTDKCKQFSAKVIEGIKVGESPIWLKNALRSLGVRSINNIVDIGNYVMMMLGQPLHMYDRDKLPKEELYATTEYEGDFVALDEKNYQVKKGDVVIASNGVPMCLGGVMGSLASEVTDGTKNIVIESATFDPATIRHTSIRLNLVSESSARFVRGINSHQYRDVLAYTSELIRDICGDKKEYEIVSFDELSHEPKVIETSSYYINHRLGTSFTDDEIISALKRVHMKVASVSDKLLVTVPYARIDIKEEADLSEEVIRLLGFDHIHEELPLLHETVGKMSENRQKENVVRSCLLGRGLDEAVTYTLVTKEQVEEFSYVNNTEVFRLLHPLTDKHEYVRRNILPSLLEVATYNLARKISDFGLFEVSDVFTQSGSETHLAIILIGSEKYQRSLKKINYDYYDAKGYLEAILKCFGIEESRYRLARLISDKGEFHPGKSATISIGKVVVGVMGELHPEAMNKYDLGKTPAVALEINLSAIFALKSSPIKMASITRFPLVSHDLALVIKENIEAKEIIRVIKSSGNSLVKNAEIFDVYMGDNIQKGYKSVAVTVYYGNDERTLKDEEVVNAEREVKHALSISLGAELRA